MQPMEHTATYCRLLFAAAIVLTHICGSDDAQDEDNYYLRKWPNVSEFEGQGTIPLYIGLSLSFGGSFDSSSGIPGVQVALNEINSDPYLLPGYTLHYTLTDSQCDRTQSLESFFKQINAAPMKVAWLGSGCSLATEPVAEISHYYNITHMSCQSTSDALANRNRFRYYFQILDTGNVAAYGFFAAIREFGWRRVIILEQNESLFTRTTILLTELLTATNIEFETQSFQTEDGISGLGPSPFEIGEGRIFVILMYPPHARELLCRAVKKGVRYPLYMLLTFGWYPIGWWKATEAEDAELGCTSAEREAVIRNMLILQRFDASTNLSKVADTGISVGQFEELYHEQVEEANATLGNIEPREFGQGCYDATLTLAYALNNTLQDLKTDPVLNAKAASASGLPNGEVFRMDDFTYSNNIVAETMVRHLHNTDFNGVTGHIIFNSEGIRGDIHLEIWRYIHESNGLTTTSVAEVVYQRDMGVDSTLDCPGDCKDTVWEGGPIPYDGLHVEEIVTVDISLCVVYSILATGGIILTVVCLVFNYIFRETKLIRLSSPNLSYIICGGAIMLYIAVYLTVIPTTDRGFISVTCNLAEWITTLGYSLCFGTMLAKMSRVYYIFSNPTGAKRKIHDWHLALVVLALVLIDVLILTIYALVEGLRGHLDAKRIPDKENPIEEVGELGIITEYYLYTCASTSNDITLGILYGYKGVLQAVALLFAFQIRKVKVKGLNDAKYITGAIYVTSTILVVTIVSTFALSESVSVYPVVFGLEILLGTTAILVLAFVPKMVELYRDPHGEKIFSAGDRNHTSDRHAQSFRTTIDWEHVDPLRRKVVELENQLSMMRSRADSNTSKEHAQQSKPSVCFNLPHDDLSTIPPDDFVYTGLGDQRPAQQSKPSVSFNLPQDDLSTFPPDDFVYTGLCDQKPSSTAVITSTTSHSN